MTKTAKGRATRRAFQDAARRVFARDGYLSARIDDIAAEAGKSAGAFYLYFANKEELLASLFVDYDAELQAEVAELFRSGLPPKQALRGSIAAHWHHHRRKLPEIISMLQASMVNPDFAAMWQRLRANGVRSVALGIRHAQKEGFCPSLDPDIAASALAAMIEYFCYVWQATEGDTDVELTDGDAIDTLYTLWSHAIYWREPLDPDEHEPAEDEPADSDAPPDPGTDQPAEPAEGSE
jgi:AcrR family transcriptional regulator